MLVLGLALYAMASHVVFSQSERFVRVAVMWLWIPLALAAAAIAWRTRLRWTVSLGLCGLTVLVWQWSAGLITHPGILYMIQYLAFQFGLGGVFGWSLRRGHEPLVTRFARMVHGHLPPEIERYTRRVTLAWTLFFATLAAIASALYVEASTQMWSVFVNLATPVLIGMMFAVEYAVRRLSFPNFRHSSFMTSIRAFRRGFDEPESR
ncbi:MAG: hypothetical protein ACKVQA_03550 [Burkholderiales bacterium]